MAYKYLFEWIQRYFQQHQESRNNLIHPLYLQHEGIELILYSAD